MRYVIVIMLLAVLCGCSSRKQFDRDMQQRYEVQCDKDLSVYESSDIEGAKKELHDIIDLSLAERNKARYYWRFNLLIADSQARLAIIAEHQGDTNEAQRLFASASDYMALQNKAFRQEMQRERNIYFAGEDTNSAVRMTPDQWR